VADYHVPTGDLILADVESNVADVMRLSVEDERSTRLPEPGSETMERAVSRLGSSVSSSPVLAVDDVFAGRSTNSDPGIVKHPGRERRAVSVVGNIRKADLVVDA
jgi:hypothetical protein